MSSKETRFSYVYKSLKCRITEGLLLPGSRLPSSRVLKDEYQVSLFTINKVLAALREEGLIELEPRRAARVCRLENERTFSASVEAILSAKRLFASAIPDHGACSSPFAHLRFARMQT